jgi:hypothetical protein
MGRTWHRGFNVKGGVHAVGKWSFVGGVNGIKPDVVLGKGVFSGLIEEAFLSVAATCYFYLPLCYKNQLFCYLLSLLYFYCTPRK